MNAIGNLQYLVAHGFRGVPVHNDAGELDALLYTRFWRSGAVDVLIVYSHEEAFAYRATGIDLSDPLVAGPESVRWRQAGNPEEVTEAALDLPVVDETGPITTPPANCAMSRLWTP